jgi:hypothetical protein
MYPNGIDWEVSQYALYSVPQIQNMGKKIAWENLFKIQLSSVQQHE